MWNKKNYILLFLIAVVILTGVISACLRERYIRVPPSPDAGVDRVIRSFLRPLLSEGRGAPGDWRVLEINRLNQEIEMIRFRIQSARTIGIDSDKPVIFTIAHLPKKKLVYLEEYDAHREVENEITLGHLFDTIQCISV